MENYSKATSKAKITAYDEIGPEMLLAILYFNKNDYTNSIAVTQFVDSAVNSRLLEKWLPRIPSPVTSV